MSSPIEPILPEALLPANDRRRSGLEPALGGPDTVGHAEKASDGSTHWSWRKLASVLGVSKDAVHRVWEEAGLKPHRLERYMASNDPEFEAKAADIIGLYFRPPHTCRLVRRR